MNQNSFDKEDEEKYFDEAEKANFIKVISSFKSYRKNNLQRVNKRLIYLNSLPKNQQNMLENYKKTLNATKQCVEQNHRIIEKFLSGVDSLFVNSSWFIHCVKIQCKILILIIILESDIEMPHELLHISDPDSDKVHVTLKQIVRDWTNIGADERNQSYKPILDELREHFDIDNMTKNQHKVLVPGAGLARLVYEVQFNF